MKIKKYSIIIIASSLILTLGLSSQNIVTKTAPLMTPWSSNVSSTTVPLPEYPRPLMERTQWMNLNGVWEFQEAADYSQVPFNKTLNEKIIVPFPWESALSGIMRQIPSQKAWYRKQISIPEKWRSSDILLHFGAIDWQATVYVNGFCAGIHKGGYDPFCYNITPYLKKRSKQEIIVEVYDPGNNKAIAHGKQNNTRFDEPKGYSYSPASGIWQTVWIEPVSDNHITDLHIVSDIDAKQLTVKTFTRGNQNLNVEVQLFDSGNKLTKQITKPKKEAIVKIDNPKLWSPDSPYLYDLRILLKDTLGNIVDEVKSYAAMRKISLVDVAGVKRLALNNETLFQMGTLDQGYWPDGIYTAPTDEALKWDIVETKAFGFNMIRKHIKVEPQRWYYWCDKLGILVWQDMPNTFKERDEEEKAQFETELAQMVRTHWNHPSIVNWIVFNEHWGLYDVGRLTISTMSLDPTRLVTGNSGVDARKPNIDYEVGHIKDNHSYRPPHVPLISSKRATVNGEYGAIGYKVEGHIWDIDGPWVHFNYEGKEAATKEYEKFINLINGYVGRGLSAAVYTQWTDVENEMNGIYTYNRKVIKLDKKRVNNANLSTYSKKENVTGQTDSQHIQ